MGFDTLGTLLTTVPGLFCLGTGALLMLVGARWNRGLVRRAGDGAVTPGLDLDLMAIAMSGGGSLSRARELVDAVILRFDIAESAPQSVQPSSALQAVLDLSERAGVPAAELLRSEAEHARLVARTDGQRRAATLAVTLMLPLGLCILPAFMLVGVAPLLISVVSSTFGSL
jgi:tight adherence protein B